MNIIYLADTSILVLVISAIIPLKSQSFGYDSQWNPISTEQRPVRSSFPVSGSLWPILNNRAVTSGYENSNRKNREQLVRKHQEDYYQKTRPWDNVIEKNLGDLVSRQGYEPRRSSRQLTPQQFQSFRRSRPNFNPRIRNRNNQRFNNRGFPPQNGRIIGGRNQFREFPGNRNNQVGSFLGSNNNQLNGFSQSFRNDFPPQQQQQASQKEFPIGFGKDIDQIDEVKIGTAIIRNHNQNTQSSLDEENSNEQTTASKITTVTTPPISKQTDSPINEPIERKPKVLHSPALLSEISPVVKPDDHMVAPYEEEERQPRLFTEDFDGDFLEEDFSLEIEPEAERQPRRDNVQPRRDRKELIGDRGDVDAILEDTIFRLADSQRDSREFRGGEDHDDHDDQNGLPSSDSSIVIPSDRRGRNRGGGIRRLIQQGVISPGSVSRRGRLNNAPRDPREFVGGDHHDDHEDHDHEDHFGQLSNNNNIPVTSGRRGRNRNGGTRRTLNQGLIPPGSGGTRRPANQGLIPSGSVSRRGRLNDNNPTILVTPRNNNNNFQQSSSRPSQRFEQPNQNQQVFFQNEEQRSGRDGHDDGYSAPTDTGYSVPIEPVAPPQSYGQSEPIGIKKFTGMDSNFLDKFTVMYATQNDINWMFEGEPRTVCDEDVTVMKGSYDYVGPDGNTYKVEWYADETGFHPTLDHLPVLPIPDHPEVKAAVEAQLAAAAALGPPPAPGPPPCPPKDQPSYSAPLPDYSKKI